MRYFIVHAVEPILDFENPSVNSAHAFGPFGSWEDADAFNHNKNEDDCYKLAIAIVGPHLVDVELSALEGEA